MKLPDTGDLIELHVRQRWSLNRIAKHYGVKWDTIKAHFDKAGFDPWNATRQNRVQVDVTKIVKLFQNGVSVKAIAKELNITRSVVQNRLRTIGFRTRNGTEANLLRFQNTSKKERQRITAAAHAAVRGMRRTEEDLCKRAQGKAAKPSLTEWERVVQAGLTSVGLPTTPQYAIGKYNVDLLITETPFIVEVFGGGWHAYGWHAERFRSRYEFIRNTGYVVFIR
ncbi:hypothetical protein KKH23_10935, partial [Patescibacteria group bacterium]|nr:hypothetical protein [Patescibacteria group bacterium]